MPDDVKPLSEETIAEGVRLLLAAESTPLDQSSLRGPRFNDFDRWVRANARGLLQSAREVAELRRRNEQQWQMLEAAGEIMKALQVEVGELHGRIITIADEACGTQPVMPADEALTLIERKLFELRVDGERERAAKEQAEREVAELRGMPLFVDGPDEAAAIRERHPPLTPRTPREQVCWELGYDSAMMDVRMRRA
jgi:hypothetical protein